MKSFFRRILYVEGGGRRNQSIQDKVSFSAKRRSKDLFIIVCISILLLTLLYFLLSLNTFTTSGGSDATNSDKINSDSKNKSENSQPSKSKISTKEISPYSNHIFMSTLPSSLISDKRLIFIGDVHGALKELDALLEKLDFSPTNDHLIFTGDLCAKGSDSLGVLRRVRELGASSVRGNHDDKVVRWKGFLKSLEVDNKEFEVNSVPKDLKIGTEHESMARDITEDLYETLLSFPLILDIPEYNLYVVHAGLLPDIPLTDQSPFDIMNMRNVKSDGTPTKQKHKGRGWFDLWNQAQSQSGNPRTIIYGHDASRGLHIKKYTIGLDSGCGSGRELTALIWNKDRSKCKFVSVKCSRPKVNLEDSD
ncbi:11663_t:CDS:2 [Ambispora gerdemannii]|uniref:11663_t:CDS:1 n=1 Tax=Ambispora gerdemannii TaxID=144530 RepID=A0A9N8W2V2_9GLOM|nr:11663_t:CDS:2 [Ambispora gerdemannii]